MSSRIPGFYRFSLDTRLERVALARDLPANYKDSFIPGGGLPLDAAGLMIENVIGVMGMPVGIALNLLINGREYLVPMVLEEPSVVAAVSYMAKVTRACGGIQAEADPSVMIGQIQIRGCARPERASEVIRAAREELIDAADKVHPQLKARGGGVRDIDARWLHFEEGTEVEDMVIVHVYVDTLDAMGANIVNTLVEHLGPGVATLLEGQPGIRILSNLADRRLARARVVIPVNLLKSRDFSGESVVEGILAADRFAAVDPYRAATHNKGIMNGIDAVAVATGNDWRAVEAGAHAYAARDGRYRPLSRWRLNAEGQLEGNLELPLQVGVVGGPIHIHPTIRANLHILGVETARELARVMVAVGLAQNLAALRALGAEGIQRGHMSLHAHNVAVRAGIPLKHVREVARQMVESGKIHRSAARAEYEALGLRGEEPVSPEPRAEVLAVGEASGKVILLGEHAVVHGYPALASALDLGVRVECRSREGDVWLEAPDLVTSGLLFDGSDSPMKVALRRVVELLQAPREGYSLVLSGNIPPGKGVGSSAALAIASIRAVAAMIRRKLDTHEILAFGHEVEKVFHGLPSGIDHTVATMGGLLCYRKGEPASFERLPFQRPFDVVLLDSGEVGPTSVQVSKVLSRLAADPAGVKRIFKEIDGLVEAGVGALASGDGSALARAMNRNHELLQELEVSTRRLDSLVALARGAGAAGAKLTGAGGGGMVLALCLEGCGAVVRAAEERGINYYVARVPGEEFSGSNG